MRGDDIVVCFEEPYFRMKERILHQGNLDLDSPFPKQPGEAL